MTVDVLTEALHRLVDGEPLASFCDWFAPAMTEASAQQDSGMPVNESELLRLQRHCALQLWGLTPVPANRWRPRGMPKLERNAPCHCGSGRKYKQCCAVFEHEPLPLSSEALLVMALEAAGSQWLTGDQLHPVPPQALGHAGLNWNESGQAQRTVTIIGPLFDEPARLDARHEVALDALLDAMLELGQHGQRRVLLDQMAQHTDKALATTARSRLVSVLADQGEDERAWKLFHETSRFNPNDPQLWPLELTLLLTQERQEEARLRAPLLAARARRAGLDGLADALLQLGQQGLAAVGDLYDGEVHDPEHLDWLELAKATPKVPDLETLKTLYQVQRLELPDETGQAIEVASITPVKKLKDLNLRWRRRFKVGKPELTSLEADVDVLIDTLAEALAFLQSTPAAWLSAEVLDDLSLATVQLCVEDTPTPVLKASRVVLDHALGVLKVLTDGAQLHWADVQHRSWLRCLAAAIDLAMATHEATRALELMRWGLTLNPHDNHGWRLLLTPMLLERGEHEAALALMAQYPDDLPPSEHLRAMALFALERQDEAEPVLRRAHQRYPLFLDMLLPELMDAPPPEPGPGMLLGGSESAWLHRLECRPMWLRSGALAWASALKLSRPPLSPPRKPAKKAHKTANPRPASPSARKAQASIPPFGAKEAQGLQKICSDYPRLHGWMQAVAWSPQLLMPNAWITPTLALLDRMPNSRTEATAQKAMSGALDASMRLYNHLNQLVLDHLNQPAPPWDEVAQVVGSNDQAVFGWAAGFAQGSELAVTAWARVGHKVTGNTGPFGRLRGLAARAVPTQGSHGRVQQDDGRPLLLALTDDETPAVQVLGAALAELWPLVAASRGMPG